jgi:hypothetical protein
LSNYSRKLKRLREAKRLARQQAAQAARQAARPGLIWSATAFLIFAVLWGWLLISMNANVQYASQPFNPEFSGAAGYPRYGTIVLGVTGPKTVTVGHSATFHVSIQSDSPDVTQMVFRLGYSVPDAKIQLAKSEATARAMIQTAAPIMWDLTVTLFSLGVKSVDFGVEVTKPPSKKNFQVSAPLEVNVLKDEPPFWSPSGAGGQDIMYLAAIITVGSVLRFAYGLLKASGRRLKLF